MCQSVFIINQKSLYIWHFLSVNAGEILQFFCRGYIFEYSWSISNPIWGQLRNQNVFDAKLRTVDSKHGGQVDIFQVCGVLFSASNGRSKRQKMCQRWSTRSYTFNNPCPRSCSENHLHCQILDDWMPTVVISPSDISCSDIGHVFLKSRMPCLLIAKWRLEDWKMNNFRIPELRLKRTAVTELNAMVSPTTFVNHPPKSTQRYVCFIFLQTKRHPKHMN